MLLFFSRCYFAKEKKTPKKIIRLTFKLSIVLGFVGITTEDSNQKSDGDMVEL